jgi:catechol 2,3-dioxygenase-like lactoylglutathione lyase family enzyme
MEYAVPIMPSRNLRETLEFYERLGFEMRGAGPEEYGYIILGLGAMIELHFWEKPDVDPLRTDHSCYIRVVDADALHAEWEGVEIEPDPETGSRLMPPCDTDYGIREFALVDTSGNLLRIGSPIEA